jgi:hypothetical protein
MTIDSAYAAFNMAVAGALVDVGYIAAPGDLRVDPESLVEPTGDEEEFVTVATVEQVQTGPVRQLLGRAVPRWIVERQCRVELAAYGPARAERLDVDAGAVAALAQLPVTLPTLLGACERLALVSVESEPLAPNGVTKTFLFTLRVRSGDPLGMSA